MEGVCCATQCSQEALHWATLNFGGAPLDHARRSKRLVRMAQAMSENPRMSLPKQFSHWSDLTAVYRFLSNEDVDPQAILKPHQTLVRRQAAEHPVVLCVQDDTQLDFTLRSGTKGLGMTGDGHGRGLLQHSAIAVLPDKRVLGVLDVAWHAVQRVNKGETRLQSQSRWAVTDVWQEAAQAVGAWPPGSRLIHVGDRHADLFRFLHEATLLGHGFVVRAMHDRYVDERAQHLWNKLSSQAALGTTTVTLGSQRDKGNRIKRVSREAQLTIRVAPILVAPPCKDPRTSKTPPLALWAVYLLEEHPPQGVPAVEWMLVTSLQAITLEQALEIIGYYTCRWVIEEWHRCLKEGCGIEKSQLDEAEDIQRLAAIMCVLAVRLLQMRDLADSAEAESPAALAAMVPPLYVQLIASLAKVPTEELTPRKFWHTIAKRGGWLGRKQDSRPGWIVLWRGWSDLVQMVRGAELYQQLSLGSKRCV
jgi:hypothetical protein